MAGRYQSKVFNFLSRQSLQLRDQAAHTWRQAKVAAVWGVQVLLYPIYVGFQTSRLAGKQLRHTVRQTLPRLKAVTQTSNRQTSNRQTLSRQTEASSSDRSIRHMLQALSELELSPASLPVPLLAETSGNLEGELALYMRQHPETNQLVQKAATSFPNVAAVRIQGIASLLETGSLVLVTTRNQVLDILSAEQQTHLSRRIAGEMAIYWRQQRLEALTHQPLLVSNYLPLPKVSKQALRPIQAFQQLMAWMQRGSVAASTNLFQESRLALLPVSPAGLSSPEQMLRTARPTWMVVEAQFYNRVELTTRIMGQLLVNAAGTAQAIGKYMWWNVVNQGKAPNQALPPASSSTIQPAQNPAAFQIDLKRWLNRIDYWLSQVPGLRATANFDSAQDLPPNQPWLTEQELFAASSFGSNSIDPVSGQSSLGQSSRLGSRLGSRQSSSQPNLPALPPNTVQPTASMLPPWLPQSLRRLLPNWAASRRAAEWEVTDTAALETAAKARLAKPPAFTPDLTRPQKNRHLKRIGTGISTEEWDADMTGHLPPLRAVQPIDTPLSSLDTANQEEAALMPRWIETEAQLVGYVKHPLEQLLEWIDQGMAWIEQRIAQIWQWLSRLG